MKTSEIEMMDLVGVRNGVETHLGKVPMTPDLKLKDIARSYGFDDFSEGHDGDYAFAMMQELVAWMKKQGWREPSLLPIVPDNASTYTQRFQDAVRIIVGVTPPADMVDEWIENREVNGVHRLQEWVLNQPGAPGWAQGIAVLDAAHQLALNPQEGLDHDVPSGHLTFVPDGYVVVKREDVHA